MRHNCLPAGGVPLLLTTQRVVVEEVGAAAEEEAAEVLGLQQQQQQIDEQDSEGAGGQLGALLWDLGTWEACIAALPAAATIADGGGSGRVGRHVEAAAVVGRSLLQHAEACGWEGTAAWVREGLGRLLREHEGLGEQATSSQAQEQQVGGEHGQQGGEAGGDLCRVGTCGSGGWNGARAVEASGAGGERQHAAREEEGRARQAGWVERLRRTWLGVEPAGFLEQSL